MRRLRLVLPASILVLCAAAESRAADAEKWNALTFHATPKPLAKDAVTTDWPRFLGPKDQPISPETQINHSLPAAGPPKVWEVAKGTGFACPSVAGGKLVLFHRLGDQETVDCLDPETGRRFWTHGDTVVYRDRYGYHDGPRASPVIDDGRIYTFGVTSRLTCLDLASGKVVWQRDCAKEDGVPQYFFGTGATPLISGDLLVVDLGGADGKSIAAFDKKSGAVKWTAKTGWGQSYAAPIPATLGGKNRVLVFEGGEGEEARDSQGGLVCLDPLTGKIDDQFFWRARRYTSVNASSPVLCGENRVWISQAYVDANSPCNGGAMVEIGTDGKMKSVWKAEKFGCHFMTPVFHGGHLYAFSGEKEYACDIVCFDAATGTEKWRKREEWELPMPNGRTMPISLKRASLLRVDGSFLCLGEWGSLCWLDLTPAGCTRKDTTQLFVAQMTWTLPALSRGLLYVCQNEKDELTGSGRRLICFDLRGADRKAE